MFENLSNKLDRAIKTLKGQGKVTEINIAATIKEIRRALVSADVNYKVAKAVTDNIKEKAIGRDVLIAVSPGQLLTKIISEELATLMGSEKASINIKGSTAIILIAGLQGSGKTTFSGKLAFHLKKQGQTVLLVACDIYRPAAIEQLKIVGTQIGVEVYAAPETKNALQIAQQAIKYAKANHKKIVIVDTAGRLAIDQTMMQEIVQLKKQLQPTETLFVVDAMTGQDALTTASAFDKQLDFDGVVLTKLDGDARGGAALSIRTVVDKPIKFISNGEKMDAIDVFHPDRMAKRILGMGDVISFVERAEQLYDEQGARKLNKKIHKSQFDFNDFFSQIQQMKKIGTMQDLVGMLPGLGKKVKNTDFNDDRLKSFEAIIQSMTPQERAHPAMLNGRRRKRIAVGSGTAIQDVNNLITHFSKLRNMVKKTSKGEMKKLMNLVGLSH